MPPRSPRIPFPPSSPHHEHSYHLPPPTHTNTLLTCKSRSLRKRVSVLPLSSFSSTATSEGSTGRERLAAIVSLAAAATPAAPPTPARDVPA
eukprot:349910-Chlamydomonas_euryale.AAC.2